MRWAKSSIPIFLLSLSLFLASQSFAKPKTPVIKKPVIKITAVGDLYFGGPMQHRIVNEPTYPFAAVQSILANTDLLLGNLEGPLSLKGKPIFNKTYILRSDPRSIRALKIGKFTAVTLANNHIMDFGPVALEETLNVLDSQGILHAGAGQNLALARKPAVIPVRGRSIALLAYNNTFPLEFNANVNRPGTARGELMSILADIRSAKERNGWVIVSFHWGEERKEWPKDYQKKFAHQCIEAGASLVIGHHPHVLQGIERYKNGLIAYSLGNFAFGSWSRNVSDSIILQVELNTTGFSRALIYPVNVNNYEVQGQTRLREGEDAKRVLQHLQKLSMPWNTLIRLTPKGIGIIE